MPPGTPRERILQAANTMFATAGMQTSLKDVAAECGMAPGSLYFHFDSKESLIIDLIERYQDDLDQVAKEALQDHAGASGSSLLERVVRFGEEIAACTSRHHAALLLSVYEAPAWAGEDLQRLVRSTPTAIHDAMLAIIRSGADSGEIRAGVDPVLLARRLCESMFRHGLTSSFLGPDAVRLPELRCRVLLQGLASEPPESDALDRSEALRAVRDVVATWDRDVDDDARITALRAAAREQFGRRGFEATTIREIATEAGLSTSTVYRFFPAKEDLLAFVMGTFFEQRRNAWDAVLASGSTAVEKLDALAWLYIVLLEQFGDEFRIQIGIARRSPPSVLGLVPSANYRDVEVVLASGVRAGDVRLVGAGADRYARCAHEALWTPEDMVVELGAAGAHALARDTLLRGALVRS